MPRQVRPASTSIGGVVDTATGRLGVGVEAQDSSEHPTVIHQVHPLMRLLSSLVLTKTELCVYILFLVDLCCELYDHFIEARFDLL